MPVDSNRNYVSEVNDAIRARAGARRRRIDSILDPLEEQGRMERMQQISVSPDLGGVEDQGDLSATIATLAGGGGMAGQMRNASARGPLRQMLGGGGGGGYQMQASATSDCSDGQCGVPQRAPMQATVVGDPAMAGMPMDGMMMGEPTPTQPPIPQKNANEPVADYFNRLSPEVFSWAAPQPASFARAGVQGAEFATALLGAASDQGVIANQRMAIEETIRNNEFARTLDGNEDKRIGEAHAAEVRHANAEATNTALQNPAERASVATELRLKAIRGDMTAQAAIDGITDLMMADAVPQAIVGGDGKTPGGPPPAARDTKENRESVRKQVAQSVNGGIAVKTFIDISPYIGDRARSDGKAAAEWNEETAGSVLSSLESAYADRYAGPWGELDSALSSEVWPIVKQSIPDLYAQEAKRSGGDEQAARARGAADAAAFYRYVNKQFHVWHQQYQIGARKPHAPTPKPQPANRVPQSGGYLYRAPPPGVVPARPTAPPSPTDSSMMFSRPTVDTNDTLPAIPAQRVARSV